MVVVGAGGVHTCFGCSVGLAKDLQCGEGIGFEGLEIVETSHFAVLGEGLGMVETVWPLLSGTGSWNEYGPAMAVIWLLYCCLTVILWLRVYNGHSLVMGVVLESSGHICWQLQQ